MHNELAKELHLSHCKFYLYQGAGPMPSTTNEMWNIYRAIPAISEGVYYNPSQFNNFDQDYALILDAMNIYGSADDSNCSKIDYGQWMEYFIENSLQITNLSFSFNQWLTQCKTTKENTQYNPAQVLIENLNTACLDYINANGKYAWDKTLNDLEQELDKGRTIEIKIDTLLLLSSVKSDSMENRLNENEHSVFLQIKMNVKFDKLCVCYSFPYASKDSINVLLQDFHPWFNKKVFSLAYLIPTNCVWCNSSSINWDSAFGDSGIMNRICTGLVVVKGVSVEVSFLFEESKKLQVNDVSKCLDSIYSRQYIVADKHEEVRNNYSFTISNHTSNAVLLGVVVYDIRDFVQHCLK